MNKYFVMSSLGLKRQKFFCEGWSVCVMHCFLKYNEGV